MRVWLTYSFGTEIAFYHLKQNKNILVTYEILKKENTSFAQINRKETVSNSSLVKVIRLQGHSFFFNMFFCAKPYDLLTKFFWLRSPVNLRRFGIGQVSKGPFAKHDLGPNLLISSKIFFWNRIRICLFVEMAMTMEPIRKKPCTLAYLSFSKWLSWQSLPRKHILYLCSSDLVSTSSCSSAASFCDP